MLVFDVVQDTIKKLSSLKDFNSDHEVETKDDVRADQCWMALKDNLIRQRSVYLKLITGHHGLGLYLHCVRGAGV